MKDKLTICKDCGNEFASDFHKECPACKRGAEVQTQKVKVMDFDMGFGSMVLFMVKWAIASIPAMLILLLIFFLINTMFVGGILAIFK